MNKIEGMLSSIKTTISLEDPENKILNSYKHENGMDIKNKSIAFGKILIIYESRPDVTIEASILAFKAGNKVILKGGKESIETNKYLISLWKKSLEENNIDIGYIEYLETNREETQNLIKNNTENVDLIIPRGGEGLINFVKNNTNIPIIVSGRGNNFAYIDNEVDFPMAINIIINGKSRISVCNALDKVLINKEISKERILKLIKALKENNIKVLGSKYIYNIDNGIELIDNEDILKEEFLSSKIFIDTAEDINEAINIINKYSGGHSSTIVSSNIENAKIFQNKVDCSAVYHNASTRFTDGGQFGFGAEIAISTQKLHSRGPIGLNQLVTNKWFIYGNGQIRT